jgi:hypothetical protein
MRFLVFAVVMALMPQSVLAVTSCRTETTDIAQISREADVILRGVLGARRPTGFLRCDGTSIPLDGFDVGVCIKSFRVDIDIHVKELLKGSIGKEVTISAEMPPLFDAVCGEEPKLEPGLTVIVFLEKRTTGYYLIRGYDGFLYPERGWYRNFDWKQKVREALAGRSEEK